MTGGELYKEPAAGKLRVSSRNIDIVLWSYRVRGLGDIFYAREFPLVLFHGWFILVDSALFLVPDHPRFSVVLSSIDRIAIVVDHNRLFDLDLHI